MGAKASALRSCCSHRTLHTAHMQVGLCLGDSLSLILPVTRGQYLCLSGLVITQKGRWPPALRSLEKTGCYERFLWDRSVLRARVSSLCGCQLLGGQLACDHSRASSLGRSLLLLPPSPGREKRRHWWGYIVGRWRLRRHFGQDPSEYLGAVMSPSGRDWFLLLSPSPLKGLMFVGRFLFVPRGPLLQPPPSSGGHSGETVPRWEVGGHTLSAWIASPLVIPAGL